MYMQKVNYCNLAVSQIINQIDIRSDGDWLYFYDKSIGTWIKHDAKQARRKMRHYLDENFANYAFNQAEIKRMEAELLEIPRIYFDFATVKNENYVNTRSGMINLKTLQVTPHNKKYYETNFLDFEFNPKAIWMEAPNWKQYIIKSLGEDVNGPKVKLLLQILVYVMSNLRGAKKMFILLGKPHSGKSKLIDFIKRITITGGNMPLTLTDLGDRFRSGLLENTRLVLNDELPCNGLKHLDLLKRIIAEEEIIIESKGKAPKCFSPRIKLVYAGNQLSKSSEYDFGNAFAERLCILVYPNSIARSEWKLDIVEQLYNERNTIMSLALMEARDLIASNFNFILPNDSKVLIDSYKKENASVQAFVQDTDYCLLGKEFREHITSLYERYKDYANENAIEPVTRSIFRQQLLMYDGIKPTEKFRLPGTTACAGVLGIRLKDRFSLDT